MFGQLTPGIGLHPNRSFWLGVQSLLEELEGATMEQQAAEVQWLFTGMTNDDLEASSRDANSGGPGGPPSPLGLAIA